MVTSEMSTLKVGEISEYLSNQPAEQKILFVDTEWTIGHARADLLILSLLDGRVYLFHLPRIAQADKLPNELIELMGDSSVAKIGNRVNNEERQMKGWNANVSPTVELGHLARARALSPTKAPSLAYLVERLYPGVSLEGKDGSGPRTSDWSGESNGGELTSEQISYASTDGYVLPFLYKEIMRHSDPRNEEVLTSGNVSVGMDVVIYSKQVRFHAGLWLLFPCSDLT